MLHEIRTAARRLARAPGFTIPAVATLALGLGASTAIFTLVDAVAIRPLSYPAADRLVTVRHPVAGEQSDWVWDLSAAGFHYYRQQARTFAALGVHSSGELTIGGAGGADRVEAATISAGLLDVLGATPVLGRLLVPADNAPGAAPVVVLGYDYWQRRFGGDRKILGRSLQVEGNAHEIVGVLAPGVTVPDRPTAVWLALELDPAAPPVNSHWMSAIGRLRPDASPAEAEAELLRLTGDFTRLFPGAYPESFMKETGFTVRVLPLRDAIVGDVASVLWILLGSVAVVLLIACANVANLVLVRSEARRRELAVRTALGAGRRQLAGVFLVESFLLIGVSVILGILLAGEGIRALLALAPDGIPRLAEVELTWRSVTACAAGALAAGLVFGLLPLARTGGALGALRDGGRGLTASRGQHAVRGALVVSQVALALVLMAAAGLMVRTFANLRAVSPGLDPRGVLTVQVALPRSTYQTYRTVADFHRELARTVEALPGVTASGVTQAVPLAGGAGCSLVFVEGRPVAPGRQPPCVGTIQVGPGYFRALDIPVAGRAVDWEGTYQGAGEVIVSRALADRLWPGEDPIGRGVRGNGQEPPYYRVVGVAGDVFAERVDGAPLEAVYFPLLPRDGAPLWSPPVEMTLVVRTSLARPAELTPAIRRAVAGLDRGAAIGEVRTMSAVVARSMARVSFTLVLVGIAAAMALLLSAVGLYGAIAYAVGQRTNEIGIRMALGARAAQVAQLVVSQSVRLVAGGALIGLAGALAATRVLRALLFGVSPTDPITLGAALMTLLAVALVAAWVPARRAARVDPMTALRAQ